MKCPKCQTEVALDDKFCRECGQDLRKPESALPIDYSQPHSYTPKFLAEKILTTRSSIEGERKHVTVLFADVANYTSMAEKLDPEQVHQIMDGCFKILMDEIHNYEGTINQFTGDGVMALFGAPLAREDHAQRACLSALGIQDSLDGYASSLVERHGIDFKMRIGLNSGPVVVGSIGDDLRMDYTAIGDTTNLAFRMQTLAKPGSTLVSPNTYKIVNQSFDFTPLGEVEVKGKEEPVEIYRLRRQRETYRPRLGLEREIYSEMVGRDEELAQLELQVMKAATGKGSIVNIIGEAGIGKSRLVAELKRREVVKRVALLEGRAVSMGKNLSFHPIIDLIKHWARITEGESEAGAFDKLRSAIRNVCGEETDEVVSFVATLMGMKLHGRYAERVKGIEGEGLEKLILKNIRDLLTKATEQTPLVIVTEDLHWADATSIELLESLFKLAETQRIVFVNVFRPGHQDTGSRIVETIKQNWPSLYTEIVLQPLDEQMSEALINNMLNIVGLTHGVRNQIVQRAGGNPFFIEEVVRSLIDEGAVVSKHGVFEVTEKIEEVIIPQTIQDVLMARIDRLDEKTRNLVKVASVIGRSFFYRILTEVGKSIDDIDQRLSYLQGIQFIRERKRMEELEYLFKHALAQEAAYDSILGEKRKELHLNVAGSIEKLFTERLHEFYGMLAYHYSKGEDWDKAEENLIKAGEEALRASASSEALYSFKEALILYLRRHADAADPAKVAVLEKNIALALHNKGQFVEAVAYFDRALAYYGVKFPKRSVFSVLKAFIGFLHYLVGVYLPFLKFKRIPTQESNEIIDLFVRKAEALIIVDPERGFLEANCMMKVLTAFDLTTIKDGVARFVNGSSLFGWIGLLSLCRRTLDVGKDKVNWHDVKCVVNYEHCDVQYRYLAGDWSAAKAYDEPLVNQALGVGDVFVTACYVVFHGFLTLDRGRFADAQKLTTKLAEIVDVYEHDQAQSSHVELNGRMLVGYRRFGDALEKLDQDIAFADRTGFTQTSGYLSSLKARIQIMLGDMEGAEDSLSRARQHLSELKQVPFYLMGFLISQFMMDLHKLEESYKHSSRSETRRNRKRALRTGRKMVRKSSKVAGDRTEALRLMGNYYWLIGKQNRALKWWNKSIKEGERLGARLELSRTYLQVGKTLLDPGSKRNEMNGIAAEEYLRKAQTLFKEMDLQWDLDELERMYPTQ